MNLHDYIRIIRRGWWLIALLAVLGAFAGLALAAIATPTYQVVSTVYVTSVGAGTVGERQAGSAFARERAASYVGLIETSTVLERAVEELNDGTTVNQLRGAIEPALQLNTSLIDINGSGSDPEQVAAWVNTVAQALSAEVARLEAANEQPAPATPGTPVPVDSPVVVSVVGAAEVPTVAVSPQPRYNVMVGGVVGFALGLAGLIVAHSIDTRIRTLSDLPRSSGLASQTTIPSRRARGFRRGAGDARVEAFRTLRANLQFGTRTGGSIAVAGVDSRANAMAVARQLAAAIGEIGSRVVVVDVDFRRSGSTKDGVQAALGLADVLRGSATVADATTPAEAENVFTIPAGAADGTTAQLLSMPQMADMLDELERDYAYVLLACPPVIERSESAVIAAQADSALVVIEAGSTKRSSYLYAMELLAGVRAASISVVLENVREIDLSARARAGELSPL
ncbi:Wzz/FepE/Etk N-terminal domain-containing protein [Lysobacter korlensis]|uniref:Wzz/FepE/Etk N-terminal domain-containing protein n=1 Tax=Lysobacter korlensis TaxID=553636 RepID=A0ABV6RWQ2_9GAMM